MMGGYAVIETEIAENPLLGKPKDNVSSPVMPLWIKDNAGWWAEGSIDDDGSFILGIGFLIKEGLLWV